MVFLGVPSDKVTMSKNYNLNNIYKQVQNMLRLVTRSNSRDEGMYHKQIKDGSLAEYKKTKSKIGAHKSGVGMLSP